MKKKSFNKIVAVFVISALFQISAQAYEIDAPQLLVKPTKNESQGFLQNIRSNINNKNEDIYKDIDGNPISKEQKERSAVLKKTYKGVTKEDVIRAANDVTLDTVFMLEGTEEGDEE